MYFEVDGKQVFAATGGEPFDNSKPVVLFLSGSGLDHTFWNSYARFFTDLGYAALIPNLPGHTNSEGPVLTSIEAMADWFNDIIGALDLDNISLLGHSQGCLTMLELASRYADRIRSVSFIASGLATPVNPNLIAAAENAPEAAIEMMLSWSFGRAATPGDSAAAASWKAMNCSAPEALVTDLLACDTYRNGKEAAAQIKCPQQVVLADKDRITPRKAGIQLVENLRSPELHIVEESGHMVLLEAEEECSGLLRDFIFVCNPRR